MIATATIYNATSLAATGTAAGSFVEVTGYSAKTTEHRLVLDIKVSNTANTASVGESLVVYYALSNFTGVANATEIRSLARSIRIPLPVAASVNTYAQTQPISVTGGSLYVWVGHDDWSIARTITANAISVGA